MQLDYVQKASLQPYIISYTKTATITGEMSYCKEYSFLHRSLTAYPTNAFVEMNPIVITICAPKL